MTQSLFSQLLDFGSLGIFAAFLIWQYIGMQRRMDSMGARFTESLDKINADYDARIEAMRERYDAVIQGIRDESTMAQKDFLSTREKLREGVIEQLNENSRKLDTITALLKERLP
tara:strand:+ start:1254 stop:1598 length:345 start_codon:yes stop_codon:yes gene_type:complete